jgi:uncharacterized protein YdeI (YjbR/CyaY-like superfamily)
VIVEASLDPCLLPVQVLNPARPESCSRTGPGELSSFGGHDLGGCGVVERVTDPRVDAHLREAQRWPAELAALRVVLLDAGLTETLKWGKPCYCHDGRNIAILQEMKHFLALMFFKGALLADPDGVLEEQGPNSRSARRISFTSVGEVEDLAGTVAAFAREAVAVEDAGLRVEPGPRGELSPELQERLDADPALAAAFAALTPGRQRAYQLYVAGAKQSSTRAARVEKHVQRIRSGKGLRDR